MSPSFGSTKGVHSLLPLLLISLLPFVCGNDAQKAPSPPSSVDPNALLDALINHREQLKQEEQARQMVAAQYYGYGSFGSPSSSSSSVSTYSEPSPAEQLEMMGVNLNEPSQPVDSDSEQLFQGNEDPSTADIDDSASNYFSLPATIGQTAGLAIDSANRLVLFHRSGRVWDASSFGEDNRLNQSMGPIPNNTLAVMDPESGKVIGEYGANTFYMPHGLTIDHDGNVWVTDVGSHQVHKLDNKTFKVMMSLGEKMVPGSDSNHFCKPTDVAVAKNGDFFVADGYCNSRIMKFNKHGELLTQFGQPNSGVPAKIGEFFVPHSLALIEDLNLLCVADRENERIQCFAAGLSEGKHYHPRAFVPAGTFFTKAEKIGRVFAIREKQHFLVGVTNRDESGSLEPQVFVMDMNTGKANTFAKGLENAHALALGEKGDIYVSQINPNQIVKFSVPVEEV